MADHFDADTGFPWCAWARRDDDSGGRHPRDLVEAGLIVAAHRNLGAQLANVLHQVVGEGIVIVQNQDHSLTRRVIAARARKRALAPMPYLCTLDIRSPGPSPQRSRRPPAHRPDCDVTP